MNRISDPVSRMPKIINKNSATVKMPTPVKIGLAAPLARHLKTQCQPRNNMQKESGYLIISQWDNRFINVDLLP